LFYLDMAATGRYLDTGATPDCSTNNPWGAATSNSIHSHHHHSEIEVAWVLPEGLCRL